MHQFTNEQIRLLRLSRQMKQERVARKLGITKQRYSELENHPRLQANRIEEILKVLGYTADTAIKFLDALPPPPKFLSNFWSIKYFLNLH